MSSSSLTLEDLFGDLNLELASEPEAPPAPAPIVEKRLPATFADTAEATLDIMGFTVASDLLSDSDQPTRPTMPYDIPADEFAQNLSAWGDDERFSAMMTAPAAFDELPADAWPTQFNLVGSD